MNDDILMEIRDTVIAVKEQNKEQFKRLERLEQSIYGNGHPGLTARVQKVEDQLAHAEKNKAGFVAWGAIILSAISAVTGYFKGN